MAEKEEKSKESSGPTIFAEALWAWPNDALFLGPDVDSASCPQTQPMSGLRSLRTLWASLFTAWHMVSVDSELMVTDVLRTLL